MFQQILLCFLLLFLIAGPAWSQTHLKVEVEGVEGEALKNIMAYLSIAHQKKESQLTEEQIRRLHGKAPNEIKTALEVYGYYRAQVQAELQKHRGRWLARYLIDLGPRMRVRQVDLKITGKGAEDSAFQELRREFPVKKDEPLNQAHYEQGKAALQQLAAERGYFQAKFTQQQLRVNLETYSATADLHFDTGPRYRFGPVEFITGKSVQQCQPTEGARRSQPTESILWPQLLARYVPFKEGELYQASSLAELQTALVGSNYFAEVVAEPCPQEAVNLKVPILVYLQANKRHHYSIGVGFGTNTGPRINLGWQDRYVNRRGHRFSFSLRASEIYQNFDLNYAIPIRDPRTDQFNIAASYGRLSTVTSTSRTGLLGFRQVTAQPGGWQRTLFLDYRRDNFNVGGESGLSYLLIPGMTWFRTQADNLIYPHRGNRISLELQGAAQPLISTSSFAQLTLHGKMIRSVGERSRFLIRGDAGVTWASDFSKLPPSIRYFAGGDQSIRGYNFYAVGAKNSQGRIIGGKNLLVGSVEYDYRFLDKWAIAGFYDAGNSFNGLSLDVQQGAGVGIRWLSPVGPVHVDVAMALSRPGTHIRLHVYIGPDL
jgi:translocation and assembly module TamA